MPGTREPPETSDFPLLSSPTAIAHVLALVLLALVHAHARSLSRSRSRPRPPRPSTSSPSAAPVSLVPRRRRTPSMRHPVHDWSGYAGLAPNVLTVVGVITLWQALAA